MEWNEWLPGFQKTHSKGKDLFTEGRTSMSLLDREMKGLPGYSVQGRGLFFLTFILMLMLFFFFNLYFGHAVQHVGS